MILIFFRSYFNLIIAKVLTSIALSHMQKKNLKFYYFIKKLNEY